MDISSTPSTYSQACWALFKDSSFAPNRVFILGSTQRCEVERGLAWEWDLGVINISSSVSSHVNVGINILQIYVRLNKIRIYLGVLCHLQIVSFLNIFTNNDGLIEITFSSPAYMLLTSYFKYRNATEPISIVCLCPAVFTVEVRCLPEINHTWTQAHHLKRQEYFNLL